MKISETITMSQKIDLVLNNTVSGGLFYTLFENTPNLQHLSLPLSIQFYTNRSANKKAGVVYERVYDLLKEDGIEDNDVIINRTNEYISSNILRPKYLDKWLRLYLLLADDQYNALYDEEYEENKNGTIKGTTTYDTEVENDGNVGTHETRTYTSESANDVYGFNSSSPVGDSTSEDNSSETIEGLAEKNTTHSKQSKSGTDSKDNEYEEKITRKGRNKTPAELLQMELDFRNKQTIISIILKDVDYEMTLKLYERS